MNILDRNGKPLMAGDKVVYASTKYGLVIGELQCDATERKAYHILKEDGEMYFPQKPDRGRQPKDRDLEMLNLTAYVKDVLDNA